MEIPERKVSPLPATLHAKIRKANAFFVRNDLPTNKSWIINGPRYAHESVLAPNPLIAALDSSCPMTMAKFMPAVFIPRKTTGEISEQ